MGDFTRSEQPGDGDERSIMLGWLSFHRDALLAKCHGVTGGQLVERVAPPSRLSLLGIVRHMTEMERVYGVWSLGPKAPLEWVWGTYAQGEEHDIDCTAADVENSFHAWREEIGKADAAIGRHAVWDERGEGNGHSIRWNIAKLVGEYARHNGHADILRERIDGQTGE